MMKGPTSAVRYVSTVSISTSNKVLHNRKAVIVKCLIICNLKITSQDGACETDLTYTTVL